MLETIHGQELADVDGDDLEHLVCCDENTALCGTDVSASAWGPGWENVAPEEKCVVCYELQDADGVCPICGE